MTDELTGLLSRRGFRGQVTKTLAQARRQDHGGVLMLIDLDRFKAVNDRFGHAAEDLVSPPSQAFFKTLCVKQIPSRVLAGMNSPF